MTPPDWMLERIAPRLRPIVGACCDLEPSIQHALDDGTDVVTVAHLDGDGDLLLYLGIEVDGAQRWFAQIFASRVGLGWTEDSGWTYTPCPLLGE